MRATLEPYAKALQHLWPIVFRHVFLLVNAIIFAVVALLFVFGDVQAAVFLGIIIVVNIFLGIIQDFRARVTLEKLQLLTAPRLVRIREGREEMVFVEEIREDDHIRLRLGDQIPCDGVLISSDNLEVSEALITGESDSFPREKGENVLAGDIVTAGSGVLRVLTVFRESRISRMTEEAKQYAATPSPIQRSVRTVVTYAGYALLGIIAFVVIRGVLVEAPAIQIVKNIGALASIIVPQGLLVITTLLFAFGAASYSRRHVLFQEINATEKLGRIKNLCMDKTGTLTTNEFSVEDVHVPPGSSKEEALRLSSIYVRFAGDVSQMVAAVAKFLGEMRDDPQILESLPFSSWRQYGGVRFKNDGRDVSVLMGSPDAFIARLSSGPQRAWLEKLIDANAHQGKRVLCVVRTERMRSLRDLSQAVLSVAAVFVFRSNLREGVRDSINFFQDRGVDIRIISGDNPETVRAIAAAAGVHDTGKVITGAEMAQWSDSDFLKKAAAYRIFARTVPEQKVKIVEALKRDGFTAMVGDGANDALAIKRADLGIAMFDGAPATRQLAGVILMNNSFTALPGAVELADNFIQNIEIFAGTFIASSLLGLFTFFTVSAFGYPYPLTPLNITLINYCTVGIPGFLISYWAVWPSRSAKPAATADFLKRVLPYPLAGALLGALAIGAAFILSPDYFKAAQSNTLVVLAFIAVGFVFFAFAPRVYESAPTLMQKMQIFLLGLADIALLYIVFTTPLLVRFFDLAPQFPPLASIVQILAIALSYAVLLYALVKLLFTKKQRARISN